MGKGKGEGEGKVRAKVEKFCRIKKTAYLCSRKATVTAESILFRDALV